MAKATPTPIDDGDDHYAPRAEDDQRRAARDTIAPEKLDESGRGPRRAIAEAIASPLGVQPSIDITAFSSFNRPAARVIAAEKDTPSVRCYSRVPP
jgi:hypothetical protein